MPGQALGPRWRGDDEQGGVPHAIARNLGQPKHIVLARPMESHNKGFHDINECRRTGTRMNFDDDPNLRSIKHYYAMEPDGPNYRVRQKTMAIAI